MELKSLVEVDLRVALAPINRDGGGQFVPAMRTAAQLRERAKCGVLDLKLSRVCFLQDKLAGTCLVERDSEVAFLDAIAVEPLAQQRGIARALIEDVCKSAPAAGVKHLCTLAAEFDSTLLGTLHAVEFARRRTVVRYLLNGSPTALPQPHDFGPGAVDEALAQAGPYARLVPLGEALTTLDKSTTAEQRLFSQQTGVLRHLESRLSAYAAFAPNQREPQAVAIFEADRRLLYALGGDVAALGPLLCLIAGRHGVACLEALVDGHPAEAALLAAGFQRASVRVELVKDL